MPSTIIDALLSPGWTREVIIIALRIAISSGLLAKFVIMAISQSFPAIVLQTMVFLILSLLSGVHNFYRSS
jgi:hypothetical protein